MEVKFDIALSFAMENYEMVEKVYRYLKAEGFKVFFAPAPECQAILSGTNQREIFYKIFGLASKWIALFISKEYIVKDVPMEEASIAFAKHSQDNSVIPIYLDDARLPEDLFDEKSINYFREKRPAAIADHLAGKIQHSQKSDSGSASRNVSTNRLKIENNNAENQVIIQEFKGSMTL